MRRRQALEQIADAEEVLRMIEQADKKERYPYNDLVLLCNEFRHVLERREHGERDELWKPYYHADVHLKALEDDFTEDRFQTAFATVRKILLSIARRYVREMRSGVQQLYPV